MNIKNRILFLLFVSVLYQTLTVEGLTYAHQPPIWRTPIGIPGDWHKPLIDEEGAWAGDFGPGPYASPLTRIFFSLDGQTPESITQSIANPRIPIVETFKQLGEASIQERAFTCLPNAPIEANSADSSTSIMRLRGMNRSPDYASPKGADAAFRTVAYGTNRPVVYEIDGLGTGPYQVFLGFTDPYRSPESRVKRLMALNVEGAPSRIVSVVDDAGRNVAQAYKFLGTDTDGDGRIRIEVGADIKTSDPNVFINAIWIFRPDNTVDETALIRGQLNNEALVYLDCGHEPQWEERSMRQDLMEAHFTNATTDPILNVETRRSLNFDPATGTLLWRNQPFIRVHPLPNSAVPTTSGWHLRFPKATARALVRIFDGGRIQPEDKEPDVDAEAERIKDYWLEAAHLPWDRIGVGDPQLQDLVDGSIRVLYQLLERVDGKLQSQPGPSVYRGLWVSNQPRVGRALTHLGDLLTARSSFERTWEFQDESGRVIVLTPPSLLKETGTAVEAVYRHARLTGDKDYLKDYYDRFKKAASWVIGARQSVNDPEALNYGLMPSGLSDGGVGGVVPEYTSVYWGLHLLKVMAEAAAWLDHYEDSLTYGAAYAEFEMAFRTAALRDYKLDAKGNPFLPIKMEFDPKKDDPVSAQTVFSYLYYPGRLFDKRDPIAEGNFAMLMDAPKANGLLLSTGWLKGGVQPFIENTRASARLYRGETETVQEVLYAIANHASPTHVWVEEQLPSGPPKTTGDVPHSSASGEFINLIRYTLALEDGETLHLCKGVPRNWIQPNQKIFLKDLPTEFGPVDFHLSINDQGNTAHLKLIPVSGQGTKDGGVQVHLSCLKAAGFHFSDGQALPDTIGVNWGQSIDWKFHKD
jgi:hypothetical protein